MDANTIAMIKVLGGSKSETPFFGETTQVVEVLGECTPVFDADIGAVLSDSALSLLVGETYIVTYNGTEYSCVAQDISEVFGDGAIGLGELSQLGLDSHGEPFAIISGLEEMAVETMWDGTGELTLSIRQEQTVITPLPVKYLPEGVPYVEETEGLVEVLAETDLPQIDDGVFGCAFQVDPIIGETYTVNYNGTEYECEAQDCSAMQEGCVGFGDLSNMGGTGNSGPFAAMCMDGTLAVMPMDGSTSVTLSIYQEDGTVAKVNKLDSRCLPDGMISLFTVNVTSNASNVTSIDKTYAEIYAAAMDSNKIVRACLVISGVTTSFLPLESFTTDLARFSVVTVDSTGAKSYISVNVRSDGTTEFYMGA